MKAPYIITGGAQIVWRSDVIAMIPREEALASRDTRRVIDKAIGGGGLIAQKDAEQRSYIICEKNGSFSVHASTFSTDTLMKR